MSAMQRVASYEHKNDYYYIILRQAPELGAQAYVLCCGINMPRFDPICWGKAGICSNPAFKGLQQLRADVSSFVMKLGLQSKNAEHFPCGLITPPVGNGWYRESPLLIERASPKDARKILNFSVQDLIKTVLTVCAPDARVPGKLPTPPAMQKFLDALNVKNYREAAPPPIAKPQGKR
jgi:hypothetical protein